jgi:hypothetical protein
LERNIINTNSQEYEHRSIFSLFLVSFPVLQPLLLLLEARLLAKVW